MARREGFEPQPPDP